MRITSFGLRFYAQSASQSGAFPESANSIVYTARENRILPCKVPKEQKVPHESDRTVPPSRRDCRIPDNGPSRRLTPAHGQTSLAALEKLVHRRLGF